MPARGAGRLWGTEVQDDLTGKEGSEFDDTATFDELRRVKLLCVACGRGNHPRARESARRPQVIVNEYQSKIEKAKDAEKTKDRPTACSRGDEAADRLCSRWVQGLRLHQVQTCRWGTRMAGRHGQQGPWWPRFLAERGHAVSGSTARRSTSCSIRWACPSRNETSGQNSSRRTLGPRCPAARLPFHDTGLRRGGPRRRSRKL